MILALFAATAVHWVTLPSDERCKCGYIGWKLDAARIRELDSRLQLPEGAYPREQYVRYYAGHIAPDGTKTLRVALVHEQMKLYRPGTTPPKPSIYINYTAKGHAFVPGGVHSGCRLIGGTFDADFKPIEPLTCTNEFIVHPPTKGTDMPK